MNKKTSMNQFSQNDTLNIPKVNFGERAVFRPLPTNSVKQSTIINFDDLKKKVNEAAGSASEKTNKSPFKKPE